MRKGLLFILIISMIIFIFMIYFVGSVVYDDSSASNRICGANVYENSNVTINFISPLKSCDTNDGGYNDNGAIINTSGITLDCLGRQIQGGGFSGGLSIHGIKTTANDTIIKSCVIYSFTNNINISSNNVTIIDSNTSKSPQDNLKEIWMGGNFNATLLNTTFTESKVQVLAGSNLSVRYYVIVNVTNSSNGAVNGATVRLYNDTHPLWSSNLTGTTDSNGFARFNVTERMIFNGGNFNFTYIVNASVVGNSTANLSFDPSVTSQIQYINLQVNTPASPASDTTPPNFTSVTTNQSYAVINQRINFSMTVADNINVDNRWFAHTFDLTTKQVPNNTVSAGTITLGGGNQRGQTFQFTTGSYYLNSVCFNISNGAGTNRRNITLDVYAVNATGVPTGNNLTVAATIANTTITATSALVCGNFTQPALLINNTLYAVTARSTPSAATAYNIHRATTNTYANGLLLTNTSGQWTTSATSDMVFRFFGSLYDERNESTTVVNSPLSQQSFVKQLTNARSATNPFTYRWCANDTSGNTNCTSYNNYAVLLSTITDTTAPNISFFLPQNDTKVNGNVTLDADASDASGVAYMSFQYKNSSMAAYLNITGCNAVGSPYDCIWNTALFSNASEGYDIQVVACDLVGNCNNGTAGSSGTINIDDTTNADFIDGTIGNSSGTITSGTGALTLATGKTFGSNSWTRSFVDFNISSIPAGATITNVNLTLAMADPAYANSGSTFNVTIYSISKKGDYYIDLNSDDARMGLWKSCQGENGSTLLLDDTATWNGLSNSDIRSVILGTNANNNITSSVALGFFSVCFKHTVENATNGRKFYNASLSGSNVPRLIVTYTTTGSTNPPITKHLVIDRTIPIDSTLVIYPGTQKSVRNTQTIILKLNVTDGSGAGINTSRIDLSLINGTGNSTMKLESGSQATNQFSLWNISSILSGSTTGYKQIPFYTYDNATPTNNVLYNAFNVQIDNQAPTWSNIIRFPLNPVYNNTAASFSVDAADNLNLSTYIFASNFSGSWANVSYNFSIGGQSDTASHITTTNLTTGTYGWRFIIFDDAGNLNQTTEQSITVLAPAPSNIVITLIAPGDNANVTTNSNTYQYNYTGTNASACWLYLDGQISNTTANPTISTTLSFVNSLADGNHFWSITCNNTNGLEFDSLEYGLNIDSGSPMISFVSPTETSGSTLSRSNILINVSSSDDNLANFTIFLYNSTNSIVNQTFWTSSPGYVNITGLSDGQYFFNATARDVFNNQNSTETRNVTINTVTPDTTPPFVGYVLPTPADGITTTNRTAVINLSIVESSTLSSVIFNWNTTNYTIVSNATVASFNFDNISSIGDSATLAVDSSRWSNNGTIVGATYATGKYGLGVKFDGVDDYINVSKQLVNGSFTWSAWVYVAILPITENYRILCQGTDAGGCYQDIGIDQATGKWNVDDSLGTALSDNVATTGTWSYLGYTYNATDNKTLLYVNSVLQSTQLTNGQVFAENMYFRMGARVGSPVIRLFNGTLDEVRIWNITLGQSQIQEQYFANLQRYNQTQWYLFVNQSKNSTAVLDLGSYTYFGCASDLIGNENCSGTRSLNIVSENSVPNINFVNPTETNASNLTRSNILVNVSVNDSDLANITVQLFNSTRALINTTINMTFPTSLFVNFTGLADGTYYFNATVTDTSNVKNYTSTYTIQIDTTKPTVSFITPTETSGSTLISRNNIQVNVTASDTNSLSNITVNLYNSTLSLVNSTTSATSPYYISIVNLANGQYFFNATATDSFNNKNYTETRNVTISLDTTVPNVTYVAPTETNASILTRNFILVNITAADTNLANVTVYLFNSTRALINTSMGSTSPRFANFSNLVDGTYYFNATANDTVGNTNNTFTYTIQIDTVNPSGVNSVPSSGSHSKGNIAGGPLGRINFTVNATDNLNGTGIKNVTLYIYNNATGAIVNSSNITEVSQGVFSRAYSFVFDLISGVYNWFVEVFDFAGNRNVSSNSTLTVDINNATIAFVSPTPANNSFIKVTTFVVNVSGNETNRNTVWTLLDGGFQGMSCVDLGGSLYACNRTFSGLAEGLHNYTSFVNDTVDNRNNTEQRVITVDTTAPAVSISSPTANQNFTTSTVSVTFTATDTYRDSCWSSKNSGGTNTSQDCSTGSFSDSYSQGSNTVTVYANDSAGNLGSASITFFVDSLKPLVQFVNPTPSNNSAILSSSLAVNVTSTDSNLANITVQLYNVTRSLINTTVSTTSPVYLNFTGLNNSYFYVNATARDIYGNVNYTETRTFLIQTNGTAGCSSIPTDGCQISTSLEFNRSTYRFNGTALAGAINIIGSNVINNANASTFIGNATNYGYWFVNVINATLQNVTLTNYTRSYFLHNATAIVFSNIGGTKSWISNSSSSSFYFATSNGKVFNSTLSSGSMLTNDFVNASLRIGNEVNLE